ncbi:hypothetical protein ACFE33_10445 [Falsihalocynthiibacter sp. SS001]|uniref:hypothetical protein n=1 Tax=Falsihalocynthiibacter sp. SS001 TaxID=3349698 RepID=UPI0036D3FD9E
MQIAFHLGAHSTDNDKLLKTLLKNSGQLHARGTVVPGPGRYRDLIRKTIVALKGDRATVESQEALFDAIIEESEAERLILSNENFICITRTAFDGTGFYPQTSEKIVSYSNLFHGYDLEFHLAISNPAILIPELFARSPQPTLADYLDGSDPMDLRWSTIIKAIHEANPDASITIWCNEDSPLIWTDILGALADVDETFKFEGEFDFIQEIMSKEGMRRLQSYLRTHPPKNARQKRRIIAAFLDKFATSAAIEMEINLEGWDDTYIERLTALYEEDVQHIAQLPYVRFLSP